MRRLALYTTIAASCLGYVNTQAVEHVATSCVINGAAVASGDDDEPYGMFGGPTTGDDDEPGVLTSVLGLAGDDDDPHALGTPTRTGGGILDLRTRATRIRQIGDSVAKWLLSHLEVRK